MDPEIRVVIKLNPIEHNALATLARKDLRSLADEIRVIIRRELKRLRLVDEDELSTSSYHSKPEGSVNEY